MLRIMVVRTVSQTNAVVIDADNFVRWRSLMFLRRALNTPQVFRFAASEATTITSIYRVSGSSPTSPGLRLVMTALESYSR